MRLFKELAEAKWGYISGIIQEWLTCNWLFYLCKVFYPSLMETLEFYRIRFQIRKMNEKLKGMGNRGKIWKKENGFTKYIDEKIFV